MTPIALLLKVLSSTEFKVVAAFVVALILLLVYMEIRKGMLDVKLKGQQVQINDRTLAGTL